jgi:hypothetical protein
LLTVGVSHRRSGAGFQFEIGLLGKRKVRGVLTRIRFGFLREQVRRVFQIPIADVERIVRGSLLGREFLNFERRALATGSSPDALELGEGTVRRVLNCQ